MLDSTALITFTAALLAGAATPGPAVAAVVARVLGNDNRSAWPYACGIVCGDLIWLTIAIAGLSTLARSHELALAILKYAGVCYLLFLAYRIWRYRQEIPSVADARGNEVGLIIPFVAGLALELGNPKTIIFYLAIMPTLIHVTDTPASVYLVLLTIALCVYVAVFAGYISVVRRSRKLVRTQARRTFVQRASAAVLAATAVAVATR
jgi:threonine/homoserine/homoserine lactone efflux protein